MMIFKLISCIFVLITHLIFKISKNNCFDWIYFHSIFFVNRDKDLIIFAKFFIHRFVIFIVFKNLFTFNWFVDVNYYVILIIFFWKIYTLFSILCITLKILIFVTNNWNFLNNNKKFIYSTLRKKWFYRKQKRFSKFQNLSKKSFI